MSKYFSHLEVYLEHSEPGIRSTAAEAMCHLIYHVSRYAPDVADLYEETSQRLKTMHKQLDSFQYRQQALSVLHEFQRQARPHYGYYSV